MAGGRIWSKDELRRLGALYAHHPNEVLADMFGRSPAAIQHVGSRHGWSKSPDALFTARSLAQQRVIRKGHMRNRSGYILIHRPTHPFASKAGYVMEHRLVMEEQLGRYLQSNEVVHHQNGDKGDNRPENLELMTHKEHTIHHHTGAKRPKATRTKLSHAMKRRFADPRNHPAHKDIDADAFRQAVTDLKSVRSVCARFGICRKSFYNKLDELQLREWYFSA